MKKIFYGCSGEGLGHASRTLAVIENVSNFEFHVFTFGKAYNFLKNLNYPHLHKINGIMFSYKNGRVDYLRSGIAKFFLKPLKHNLNYIKTQYNLIKPDLFVSDYEPSIARAAKLCNSNLISVDNQHRFSYVDMIDLPPFLRFYGWVCGAISKVYIPSPDATIISTFHYDYIKPSDESVVLTGGLLRKNIEDIKPTDEGFILVYLRDSVSERILDCLKQVHGKYKIYGAKDKFDHPDFEFKELSSGFVNDLASCSKLISTAGNQLITEARYYQKPCLLIPEPNQYEQYINAVYAERMGIGQLCYIKNLTPNVVNNFFNFKNTCNSPPNGVDKVVEVIKYYLIN